MKLLYATLLLLILSLQPMNNEQGHAKPLPGKFWLPANETAPHKHPYELYQRIKDLLSNNQSNKAAEALNLLLKSNAHISYYQKLYDILASYHPQQDSRMVVVKKFIESSELDIPEETRTALKALITDFHPA